MSLKASTTQAPGAKMSDPMATGARRRVDDTAPTDSVDSNVELVEHPRESRMNLIATRAHAIYEQRQGEHGTALEDWLQAEREIDASEPEG